MNPRVYVSWDYRTRGWYFVTVCTQGRRCIFSKVINGQVELSRLGQIADEHLRSLHQHYADVQADSHVVMPNHVHAIIMMDGEHAFTPSPNCSLPRGGVRSSSSPQAGSLSAIVRSYKAGVTLQARALGVREAIWQSRFHDHLLRGDRVISAVREYIWNNPANWADDKDNPSCRG